MILPNVGLGRLATIEKARGGSRRKEKSHRCGECGHFTLAYGRPLRTMVSRGDARSRAHELLARAAKTEFLADIDELNAPVDSGRRMRPTR